MAISLVSTANLSQRDRHYTFEEPLSKSSDINTSAISTKEWLEAVDKAKEFVNTQSQIRNAQADETLTSGVLSHATTFEGHTEFEHSSPPTQSHRGMLQKQNTYSGDNDSLKGRKRFSKRQSKSGLTAVF